MAHRKRPLRSLNQKADEVSQKGVQVKLLFDENSRKFYYNTPEKRNFEKRAVPTIPAIMLINEKMAGINILSTDKRGDNMVLYGSHPKLLKWADDLFLYFWEQGKRCFQFDFLVVAQLALLASEISSFLSRLTAVQSRPN